MTFLKNYVKTSIQKFPVPVPLKEIKIEETKEKEMKRIIISIYTLLNVWKSFIAETDYTVFLKKK